VEVREGETAPVELSLRDVVVAGRVRVRMPGRVSGPTDASGVYELACPAGAVEVSVRADTGTGRGSASVRPGEATSLTLVLEPKPPKQP
jgi:hypothetical protein